jgi:hypothetical protein
VEQACFFLCIKVSNGSQDAAVSIATALSGLDDGGVKFRVPIRAKILRSPLQWVGSRAGSKGVQLVPRHRAPSV